MTQFLTFTVLGLVFGAIYAIAASGLVITYATSNVFNMAHGAVAMVMSFVYWELAVNQGLPTLLAVPATLLIAAVFGALLERVLMRRLVDAPVSRSLTVTVGLLVLLIGVAQTLWPPTGRNVPAFFEGASVKLAGVFVSVHQLIIFAVAGLVAGGIYLLFNHTRTGIGMRAVVDDRTLLSLHGARPAWLSMLSWALGSALAALAGILLVSDVGLDYTTLTFLVVSAYAAAVVGRLRSLPLTFAGAMGLGLAQNYYQLLATHVLPDFSQAVSSVLGGLRASLPTLLLFAVMLALPQRRLQVGQVEGASLTPLPSRRSALGWGAVLIAAVAVVTSLLGPGNTFAVGQSIGFATIMLSLVLLTGYGGDVSLGQMTFAGVGALVVARGLPLGGILPFVPDGGALTVGALLAAAVAAGLVGLLIGIPALRLGGLYLGLATLAFALAMDRMFFTSDLGFGLGGSITIERPTILGISLAGEQSFAIALTVMFVLLAFGVLELRRSRYGRLLLATRDSQTACGTLGLSITRTRVSVFVLSAALAGVGGALFAGMTQAAAASDYELIAASLPLLLLAVVGGITSVTGALLGGLLLGLGNTIASLLPGPGSTFLGTGLLALVVGFSRNGIAGKLFELGRRARPGTPGPDPGGGVVAGAEASTGDTPDHGPGSDDATQEVTPVGAA